VDGELSAVEAVAQWVSDRNLASTDLMGHTLYGWRFARGGAPIPDDRPVRELGAEPVDLLRVPNRALLVEVVARDPSGDAWLTAPVGSAVPCRRVVAALVQAFGLTGSGWRLRAGGQSCAPDALLEGRLEDGGTLELVR
jgi:hypothetical protein